jgi:hypothetical protein
MHFSFTIMIPKINAFTSPIILAVYTATASAEHYCTTGKGASEKMN